MAKISKKDIEFIEDKYGISKMDIKDIENLEIAKNSIIKLVNSFRKVFLIEKIDSDDDSESKKLLGKLAFTVELLEQMEDIPKLRLVYYASLNKEEKTTQ